MGQTSGGWGWGAPPAGEDVGVQDFVIEAWMTQSGDNPVWGEGGPAPGS